MIPMKINNVTTYFFLLAFFLSSCLSGKRKDYRIETQIIQEANRLEITENSTPFDSVFLKKI